MKSHNAKKPRLVVTARAVESSDTQTIRKMGLTLLLLGALAVSMAIVINMLL